MTAADWFAKALKLLYGGASQDALEALATAIHLGPEYAEAYDYRGFAYYRLGNHDAAMENYDKAVALWPNFAEVYYFRATLYGQLKDYEKAINDYTKAIELKPTLVEAYCLRARQSGWCVQPYAVDFRLTRAGDWFKYPSMPPFRVAPDSLLRQGPGSGKKR